MGKYILKRLLWLIPVMVGVITIVFAITVFMPGDPAAALLDKNAKQEQIDEVHARLGLDKPVLERWGDYVVGVFTKFDFGTSYTTMQPVRNEVLAKLPYTLILAITSTLFAFLIGVPLGIWGALKQYTAIDAAILFLSVLFVSMPSFWLAMMQRWWIPATSWRSRRPLQWPSRGGSDHGRKTAAASRSAGNQALAPGR